MVVERQVAGLLSLVTHLTNYLGYKHHNLVKEIGEKNPLNVHIQIKACCQNPNPNTT